MSTNTSLLQRAHDLDIWSGIDEIWGPNSHTVERMNELRQLMIDICVTLDRLDQQ